MAKDKLSKAQRLEALGMLLSEIACGIMTARDGLAEFDGQCNAVYLVKDALSRLGWMADQGCVIAGDEVPPVLGDAHAWMMHPRAD